MYFYASAYLQKWSIFIQVSLPQIVQPVIEGHLTS